MEAVPYPRDSQLDEVRRHGLERHVVASVNDEPVPLDPVADLDRVLMRNAWRAARLLEGFALERRRHVAPAARKAAEHPGAGAARGRVGQRGGERRQPHRVVVCQRRREAVGGDQRVPAEEARVGVARDERRVPQHPHEQVPVRRHAVDAGPREGRRQRRGRLLPVGRHGDDLGQHRVVEDADLVAADDAGVQPKPTAAAARPSQRGPPGIVNCGWRPRELERVQRAALRLPAGRRILGVQPCLDRVPGGLRRAAGRQRPASRDGQLERHQVQTRRALGDRVLNLEPGVHLEEVEPAVRIGQELDGASVAVTDGFDRRPRRLEELISHTG